jgi:hypothetical protein
MGSPLICASNTWITCEMHSNPFFKSLEEFILHLGQGMINLQQLKLCLLTPCWGLVQIWTKCVKIWMKMVKKRKNLGVISCAHHSSTAMTPRWIRLSLTLQLVAHHHRDPARISHHSRALSPRAWGPSLSSPGSSTPASAGSHSSSADPSP